MSEYITGNNIVTANVVIEDEGNLLDPPPKVTAKEVFKSMFISCYICESRLEEERELENILKQQAANAYSNDTMGQIDYEAQEKLKEAIAKPIIAKNPQYYIGQHMIFTDLRSGEEQTFITQSSLPDNFAYFLPTDYEKKLLCLDLDETLIRSLQNCVTGEDFTITVTIEEKVMNFSIIKRPHLHEFLTRLADIYDICIYTYAIQEYADEIIDIIDTNKIVKHRLYREHCIRMNVDEDEQKFFIVKDLTRVGRALDDIVLVDNSKKTGVWEENNFLLVSSFLGDKTDNLLPNLLNVLLRLGNCRSVYSELKQKGKE